MPHERAALTLGWIADTLGARSVPERFAATDVGAITQDTRTLQKGDCYIALVGERFDGHEFVLQAAKAGACGAIVARRVDGDLPDDFVQIVLPKAFRHAGQPGTLAALHALATAWRRQFEIPVVGITGSNGKTTTKQITLAILSEAGATLATQGNLNNQVGLPLTVLKLRNKHKFAVFEMGASKRGDIAELCAICQPTIGIVTQAAAAHIEGFGSLRGVAQGKGELFESLKFDGVAVINSDDCFAEQWRESARCLHLTFGTGGDVHLRDVAQARGVGVRDLKIETPEGVINAKFGLPGAHNVMNALAAVAAAIGAEVRPGAIMRGLAKVAPPAGRLSQVKAPSGLTILDDSYNANPTSAAAALSVLAGCQGQRWMVLGEMKELGEQAGSGHADVGTLALESGVDRLFCQGEETRAAADAFGDGAEVYPDQASLHAALEQALAAISEGLLASTTVLVKGSRGARLEHTVTLLRDAPDQTSGERAAPSPEAAE